MDEMIEKRKAVTIIAAAAIMVIALRFSIISSILISVSAY